MNETSGMILDILFAPETNALQKKEELMEMISLKTLISYRWYQLKYWYWKMEKEYEDKCRKLETKEMKQRTMIKVKI